MYCPLGFRPVEGELIDLRRQELVVDLGILRYLPRRGTGRDGDEGNKQDL
jgi:hypothetical protein